MNESESGKSEELLDQLKTWPSWERLRLARQILETLEVNTTLGELRSGSLKDMLGLLKSDAPPPTDQEYRDILEEELVKKHLR